MTTQDGGGHGTTETDLPELARNWTRRNIPKGAVDPDATLRFFQALRTDDRLRRMYLDTTGCETGFERDHPGKWVNAQIAKAIKEQMGAENEPGGEEGVEGEFIQSYQRFVARP